MYIIYTLYGEFERMDISSAGCQRQLLSWKLRDAGICGEFAFFKKTIIIN